MERSAVDHMTTAKHNYRVNHVCPLCKRSDALVRLGNGRAAFLKCTTCKYTWHLFPNDP